MGNLLGSPITEKDTHVGITHDSNGDHSTSSDGGGLPYGISSMQGWRIHMEDAHIAQPFLYAERLLKDTAVDAGDKDGMDADKSAVGTSGGAAELETPCKKTAIEVTTTTLEGNKNATEVNVTTKTPSPSSSNQTSLTSKDQKYLRIPLPNHSLFAVFDGHGGSFAAEYAARNLLRVLCRSEGFCLYAEKWRGREGYLREERQKLGLLVSKSNEVDNENDESSEKVVGKREKVKQEVKHMKDNVKRHLDCKDTTNAVLPNQNEELEAAETNTDYQYARATYDHEMMTLLERSLRDAFCDLDAEILREVRGEKGNEDANLPYGAGYDLSMHSLEGCVGHLPRESVGMAFTGGGGGEGEGEAETTAVNTDKANTSHAAQTTNNSNDHPTPSDDEDAGTTAVVVVTTPKWIICANAGDSRAVYSRSNHRAVPLSYDHKPDDEDEERRIREAGGYVSGGRVEGDLAVSRGLGDFRFKDLDAVLSGSRGEGVRRNTSVLQRQIADTLQQQREQQQGGGAKSSEEEDIPMLLPSEQKVSPLPDIIVQNRDPKEDEFIIIACDGIWDVQTNQECVNMVADIFAEGEDDLGLVCEEILDQCLIKGSKDNMTASVIKFPKQTIGKGGGVTARRERRGASSSVSGGNGNGGGTKVEAYVPPALRDGNQSQEESKGDDQ